jgi:beta-galactosidase/beta-glucuronidase
MRHVNQINNAWEFHLGDIEPARVQDESEWDSVSLPHDWSIEGPFDRKWASATGYLPGGVGWYRREIGLPENLGSGKIYLHFDGVCNNSSVWVNGVHLGDRPSGFTPFRYDITSLLKRGERIVVAVRCDHSKFADSRWYTGSGINRNVYLIATGLVHIKQWGIFATTSGVTDNSAEISVQSTIQNHCSSAASCRVEQDLYDSSGHLVANTCDLCIIAEGAEATVSGRLYIDNPKLWSVEEPYLYRLQTRVYIESDLCDIEETPVGIRTFNFDAQTGFSLNGKNFKLKGVCIHDDAGALGTAVPAGVWKRRLRLLKECGVNALRMAHNPHMPELYDLCDQMGLLVQDEAFDEWEHGKNKWIEGWNVGTPGNDGYSEHFLDWSEADLRDMVLSNRNHPSIIMWSIGNEIDYPNDPYTHEILNQGASPQIFGNGHAQEKPHASRLGDIAARLVRIARQHDTTRPITAALASALMSNETGYPDALDIVGYNYQESRYAEDHARYPDRIVYGSENGMLWSFWDAVASNPYISGQFLWTGIDYLGEAHSWPHRSNRAGLMDLAGFPKAEYFYRKSLWTEEPMVYLGTCKQSEHSDRQGLWDQHKAQRVWSGLSGELMRVKCFTNCRDVELFSNGKSLGRNSRAGASEGVISWDVPYEAGELTVEGFNDGDKPVAFDRLVTAGTPIKLAANCDIPYLSVDSEDIAHIDVTLVDADGNACRESEYDISWTVEGGGRLLGLESGYDASHEDYKSNCRRTFEGRLLGYIKATEPDSTIKITLSSPGLESAVVLLPTTEHCTNDITL